MEDTKQDSSISPSGEFTSNGFGRVGRQASIRFSGLAFDKLVGYAFALFVASYYGSRAFGLYLFGVGVIEVILAIARLGMERAEVREIAHLVAEGRFSEIKGVVKTALRLTLPVSFILALAAFAFSRQLAEAFGDIELGAFLQLAAPAILLSIIADVFLWATEAQGDQRFLTIARLVAEPVSRLSLAIVFFLTFQSGADERALALSYSIATAVGAALGYWFYRKRDAKRAAEESRGSYTAKLLRVGLPFCGTVVLNRLLARAEIFLLFGFVSAAATAQYTLAQRTALLATMIAFATDAAFRPTIAQALALGRYDQARAQFLCVARSTLMVCLPACLLLALFPRRVMAVVGEQFIEASPVVMLIAIATLVTFTFGPTASALAMAGLTNRTLANGLIAGVIGLALDLTLIPQLGILGAGIAQSVSMIALAAINAFSAYRATGVLGTGRAHLKLLVAALIAAGAGLLTSTFAPQNKYAAFVVLATVIVSVYVVTIAIIKPAPEDWQLIKGIFSRHTEDHLAPHSRATT